MKDRHVVIPIFIPHKGCPFDCIYCNQKTISGQLAEMSEEEMTSIIEDNLSSIPENTYIEIGFYGGSFTGIEKEQQINFLKLANKYITDKKVREIRLSTRPDYINAEILDYLREYNVKTIELGVQSLDEDVLLKSCRGHSIESVFQASQLIKNYGINLGIQTMIGLPGDSREKDIETAKKVVELSPKIIRIYPTLVIRDTYLEKLYNQKKYIPLTLEEAVEICAELLDIYESKGINVIRVGLQATENISENEGVVSGPFHPAFRQLVESRRMYNNILKQLNDTDLTDEREIIIYTGNNNVSNVVGQKRENIKKLITRFGFKSIDVRGIEGLERDIGIERIIRI